MEITEYSFDALLYNTYVTAYEHAQEKVKCAHVACSVISGSTLVYMASNTHDLHAEVNALGSAEVSRGKGEKYCVQCV